MTKALLIGIGLVAVLAAGCSEVTEPNLDSETHWLTVCEANSDCQSPYSCICGTCTLGCQDSTDCSDTGEGAICTDLACDGVSGAGSGVCLPTCQSDDQCSEYNDGLSCTETVCQASASTTADPEPDAGDATDQTETDSAPDESNPDESVPDVSFPDESADTDGGDTGDVAIQDADTGDMDAVDIADSDADASPEWCEERALYVWSSNTLSIDRIQLDGQRVDTFVEGVDDLRAMTFSPDGDWLYYTSHDAPQVSRISLETGLTTPVVSEDGLEGRGIDFDDENTVYFGGASTGIHRFSVDSPEIVDLVIAGLDLPELGFPDEPDVPVGVGALSVDAGMISFQTVMNRGGNCCGMYRMATDSSTAEHLSYLIAVADLDLEVDLEAEQIYYLRHPPIYEQSLERMGFDGEGAESVYEREASRGQSLARDDETGHLYITFRTSTPDPEDDPRESTIVRYDPESDEAEDWFRRPEYDSSYLTITVGPARPDPSCSE